MKYLVIFLIAVLCATINGRPTDEVEVEKVRLIKFPDNEFQYQSREQSEETRRIMEEINKVNLALGYVKKQQESSNPVILDSDLYLYPKPSFHPALQANANGIASSPSFRNLRKENHPMVSRKIVHHHSLMLPHPVHMPFYYPETYLRLPLLKSAKGFREIGEDERSFQSFPRGTQNIMAIANDVTRITEYIQDPEQNNEYTQYVENGENDDEEVLEDVQPTVLGTQRRNKKAKSKLDDDKKPQNNTLPKFVLLPAKLQTLHPDKHPVVKESKLEKQRINTKVKTVLLKANSDGEKSAFGFLRPKPSAQIQPSKVQIVQQLQQQHPQYQQGLLSQIRIPSTQKPSTQSTTTESEEDDDSSGDEKHILFGGHKNDALINKEALKEGGIIIQRLKVRKGGIAIAGPGGVATAGSGGTAIVGPGGLALTHPRSLTIAGPGARVVALPESYDLDRAVLGATSRNLPPEGRVVATGPTIYYRPAEVQNPKDLPQNP